MQIFNGAPTPSLVFYKSNAVLAELLHEWRTQNRAVQSSADCPTCRPVMGYVICCIVPLVDLVTLVARIDSYWLSTRGGQTWLRIGIRIKMLCVDRDFGLSRNLLFDSGRHGSKAAALRFSVSRAT